MSKLKTKEKKSNDKIIIFLNDNFNLVIIFILIVFLTLAYMLIIKPKYETTLIGIKDNINQQELFYASQKQRLVDLQTVASLYTDLEEDDILKVQSILPAEYAKEKLFGQLEDIITQQGVVLSSIDLSKDSESDKPKNPVDNQKEIGLKIPSGDKVGIIEVEIQIEAIDYATLKNLLPLLESHVQLLDISSIDFDSEGESVSLSLRTYYYK
ncbi:MAG: hypothetical protein EOM88_02995 [Clostridia bacterium]|nr:hypothetical protein [Clostridia bacterium]